MLQTVLVYSTLSAIFILLFYLRSLNKNNSLYAILAILLFSIVMGVRYGVGVDYLAYKDLYETYRQYRIIDYFRMEYGFALIIKLCAILDCHYTVFFGLIAFFQAFLIFKTFEDREYLYPYLAYTFMIGCIWYEFCNGMRQELAFCLFVFAIKYIQNKKFLPYLITIIVASLIHRSGILLLLLYPLFYKNNDWFKSISIQYIFLCVALILSQLNIIDPVLNIISPYLHILNYEDYLNNSPEKLSHEVSIGLGFVNLLCIHLIQIFYSNKVKRYFKDISFNIIYSIYLIGVIWNYLFLHSQLFLRFNYYLLGLQFIVSAYVLRYLHKKSIPMFCLLLLLYFLIFISFLIDSETSYFKYYFFWQANEYINPEL